MYAPGLQLTRRRHWSFHLDICGHNSYVVNQLHLLARPIPLGVQLMPEVRCLRIHSANSGWTHAWGEHSVIVDQSLLSLSLTLKLFPTNNVGILSRPANESQNHAFICLHLRRGLHLAPSLQIVD